MTALIATPSTAAESSSFLQDNSENSCIAAATDFGSFMNQAANGIDSATAGGPCASPAANSGSARSSRESSGSRAKSAARNQDEGQNSSNAPAQGQNEPANPSNIPAPSPVDVLIVPLVASQMESTVPLAKGGNTPAARAMGPIPSGPSQPAVEIKLAATGGELRQESDLRHGAFAKSALSAEEMDSTDNEPESRELAQSSRNSLARGAQPPGQSGDAADLNPAAKSGTATGTITGVENQSDNAGQISPLDGHGISAALQDGTMQATQEVNENSASTGQNLPAAVTAYQAYHSPDNQRKELHPEGIVPTTVDEGSGAVPVTSQPASNGFSAAAEESLPQTSANDSVHRSIENAVAGTQSSQAGSLSMVLNPDRNTQLFLHVRMQEGHLQAQVVVQRGDFASLRGDWGHLQTKLAEQGVRLAPLTSTSGNSTTFTGGNNPFAQRQRDLPSNEYAGLSPIKTSARVSGAGTSPAANESEWWA